MTANPARHALVLGASLLALSAALTATIAPADEARVEVLLARLTRAEKLALLGGNEFETRPVPRLGIPPLTMTDGPAGVRWDKATAFPAGIALAATWDTALVRRVAGAIAREARAKGRHMLLGPCVNIGRVPLGGRVFEGFGEDPHLASRLAVAYVRGVQAEGVAATVKHFAANNQEWKRDSIDARIEPRALREIYFPAFKAAVQEGGAWAVMSAYNRVNGAWCSENPFLLRDVLKGEWGFDGLVVSDWGAVHSTVGTAQAGLDVEMPAGVYLNERALVPVLERGDLTEAVLDDKVRRLLRVLERTGALDGAGAPDPSVVNSPEHRALALEAARRSLVLLRNERALLPLDRGAIRTLAVIGPNAAVARTGGGGSSYVSPFSAVAPLEGLRESAGPGVSVAYAEGVRMPGEVTPIDSSALVPAGERGGRHGLRGEYFASMDLSGRPALVRVDPTVDFDWGGGAPAPGLPVDRFSVRWTGTLIPAVSGTYELSVRGDDGVRLKLDGKVLLEDWSDHGARTSTAVLTLEAGKRYAVALEFYENGGAALVQLGWHRIGQDRLEAAVAAARAADVAVVVVGDSPGIESEGFDRTQLELPDGQAELIRAVACANPRTVVVVVAGAPVAMSDWIDEVPAVVQAWFPGEQGGTAIGEVVFGDAVPSGRLPVSFPKRWQDSSAFPDYPGRDLVTHYTDGVFVGYRHLDRAGIEPQFAFGHGLSYTTFAYSDLRVEPVSTATGRSVRASFLLRNTGARTGTEVAQVYVSDPGAGLPRPPRELKAFTRVELAPGDSARVAFELDHSAFEYYDPVRAAWRSDPGEFVIHVGASSRDLRLSQGVRWP